MTQPSVLADLQDLSEVLQEAGFNCEVSTLGAFPRVLIARNAYGIVAALEVESWLSLEERASDLQAELTHLALSQDEQGGVRWDLYVLLHVRNEGLQSVQADLVERLEADTKYARKFVRVNLIRDAAVLDRALRPFLPLRAVANFKAGNPLQLLEQELLVEGIPPSDLQAALSSFQASGEVVLP